MNTKKVAIIGASGYSGEELVRLLLSHPHVELVAVTSRQYAGQTLAQVFPKFASHPRSKTLHFTETNAELLAKQADVVFLALPHGVAAEYAIPLLDAGRIVIDLSADFRLKSAEVYREFYAHDVAGDLRRHIRRRKFGDRPRPGFAGDQPRPCPLDVAGERRDQSQSRDHNSTHRG